MKVLSCDATKPVDTTTTLSLQGMSDYSQGPPVSPESTTQGPLWHVVDTCTQFVIATARMHALAETQGGEVAPWQDPQQYGAAFTCSVRKLVQLACSPHPLEAQVSKDVSIHVPSYMHCHIFQGALWCPFICCSH